MDKRLLKKCVQKYVRFDIDHSVANETDGNFDRLLEFIGEHKDCGRPNNISNAYKAIRVKTQEMMKVGKLDKYTLKTSKREITAIRICYNAKFLGIIKTNKYIIKIPFKSEDIFKAIITLVAEIKDEKGINLPQSLKAVYSMCYGDAFYKKHMDTYENRHSKLSQIISESDFITADEECQLALFDSFLLKTLHLR